MKKYLLLAALIVAVASCDTVQKIESNPYASAATNFASNCAKCHGVNGTTGKATPLDHISSAAEAVSIITNGKGNMPSFKNKLSTSEINALGQFVAAIGKK
jgi:mono/diheme cytochrome c family protein